MIWFNTITQKLRMSKVLALNALVIALLIIVAIAGRWGNKGAGGVEGDAAQLPRVRLLAADEYRTDRRAILTDGGVEAEAQVEIKAQINAPVARIFAVLGQSVVRGQTLLTLENSDLAAQVAQAQAGVEVQRARLQEVKRGARAEERAIAEKSLEQAVQGLLHQQQGIFELVTDAYAKTDDAVRAKTDALFVNDDTPLVLFSFTMTDVQAETDGKDLRMRQTAVLNEWKNEVETLSAASAPEELERALGAAIARLREAGDFFAAVARSLANPAGVSPAALEGYRLNANIGRTTVSGLTTALTSYERALADQKINIERIREQVNLTETGASPEQIAIQEALLQQAEASVQLVSAQYQKTVISAPLSGKVAALPVKVGDLAGFGAPLIALVNTEGLKIKIQVSGEDAPYVDRGAKV